MDDSYSRFKNHYSTLGVERNATKSEIKSAFRKLVKIWHPDNNKAPDAEAKFKEIGAAYEILNNDSWRAEYDELLREYEERIRYEQNKAYQQTNQGQSKTYGNNDATSDGQTSRDSQYGSERQTDYKQYNQNNYYSNAYSNWEQRARTFREQDEARAWEQAARYAGMAVGEVLASIVDTVLYGEKEGRGSLNFIDYNLLGLKVWICAGLAALCFTLVFALPAAYIITLIIKSFFHKERFVGFVPLAMGTALVLSEFLLAGFLIFELPEMLDRANNTASESSFQDTAYYDSWNENDRNDYDAVYNDFDDQYEAEPDYSDFTAYILSPDYDSGNFRVEPSLNAGVPLVVQQHEILRYLEEEAYDAEDDILWYKVYHEATGSIGWMSSKLLVPANDSFTSDDNNDGAEQLYATALQEFMTYATDKTSAALVDLDGDGVHEMIALDEGVIEGEPFPFEPRIGSRIVVYGTENGMIVSSSIEGNGQRGYLLENYSHVFVSKKDYLIIGFHYEGASDTVFGYADGVLTELASTDWYYDFDTQNTVYTINGIETSEAEFISFWSEFGVDWFSDDIGVSVGIYSAGSDSNSALGWIPIQDETDKILSYLP